MDFREERGEAQVELAAAAATPAATPTAIHTKLAILGRYRFLGVGELRGREREWRVCR